MKMYTLMYGKENMYEHICIVFAYQLVTLFGNDQTQSLNTTPSLKRYIRHYVPFVFHSLEIKYNK